MRRRPFVSPRQWRWRWGPIEVLMVIASAVTLAAVLVLFWSMIAGYREQGSLFGHGGGNPSQREVPAPEGSGPEEP